MCGGDLYDRARVLADFSTKSERRVYVGLRINPQSVRTTRVTLDGGFLFTLDKINRQSVGNLGLGFSFGTLKRTKT